MLSALLYISIILAVLILAVALRFAAGDDEPGNMTVHQQEDEPPERDGRAESREALRAALATPERDPVHITAHRAQSLAPWRRAHISPHGLTADLPRQWLRVNSEPAPALTGAQPRPAMQMAPGIQP